MADDGVILHVIKELKWVLEDHKHRIVSDLNKADIYTLSVVALEKQVPTKLREHYYWNSDLTEEEKLETSKWICRKCDSDIEEHFNYCRECGQKIDWD